MIDFDRLMTAQQDLIRAVTQDLPDDWTAFVVDVEITPGGQRVRLDGPSLRSLQDDAYEPLRQIELIHKDGGHPLAGFTYDFERRADGSWTGAGEFRYVDP